MLGSQPNMLVFDLKIIDKTGCFYKIKLTYKKYSTLIAFSPERRNLVFLRDDKLTEILEKNEYQIRKLLHNKRKSTFYVGFEIKFAIRDNKQVQEFNDPGKIIVLDRRNGKYLSYVKDRGDSNVFQIFTDGCYLHNARTGSYVALMKKLNGLYDITWGYTTNPSNSTLLELLAAIKGLEQVPKHIKKIRIITDSRYVIKGLTEWVINWQLNDWYTIQGRKVRNIEYWKRFEQLTRGRYIEFQWIKGHSFHFENTICDRYAKQIANHYKPDNYEENSFLGNTVTHSFGSLQQQSATQKQS